MVDLKVEDRVQIPPKSPGCKYMPRTKDKEIYKGEIKTKNKIIKEWVLY